MTDVDGWPFSFVDEVRYGDLDANGHMNNVVFLQFFESARIAFMRSLDEDRDPVGQSKKTGTGMIFAECHINYRAPAFYPEVIRTYIRPSHLRRSSIRCEFRMCSETDGRVVAEGWGAMVGYDYEAGRPTPLPEPLRTRLLEAGATTPEEDQTSA